MCAYIYISFLTNHIRLECNFKPFLLPMIKDVGRGASWCGAYQTQPCWRVRYAAFEATFGMWNIKQVLCQLRSHGTFWWHALLFTALSAPFSLALRVFLRLSALQLRCQLCRLHCFGFCLQFWHERLPRLGPPPPPSPLSQQPPPSTHPFSDSSKLKRRNRPLPDFC